MKNAINKEIITKEVQVICQDACQSGELDICVYSRGQRVKRALKKAVICLVILTLSACVPVAHFILVPTVLVLAPILIYRSWAVEREIISARIKCAKCQGELTSLTTKERYPIFESCRACQRENRISG
jgi:hypothetical protein